VKDRFNIAINPEEIEFVQLYRSADLKPENYPSFTMLWQAVAQIRVCLEAMRAHPCDIFIDTMGAMFAYPFVKALFNPILVSYTHYPLVSYDMLDVVMKGTVQFNNSELVSRSPLLKKLKKIYYWGMTVWFAGCRFAVDRCFTNSTWTNNHMLQLWQRP